MNIAECLSHADIATLRGIASTYKLNCSMHSKLELMQEILYTFRSKTFLVEQLPKWREGTESVFMRLCLDTRNVFSAEEIRGMFLQTAAGEERLKQAMLEGWLFPTTRLAGRLQYAVPKELHSEMGRSTVAEFFTQAKTVNQGPYIYREEALALARDTDLFLQYVSNYDVQLAADGSMYKRHLTKVLEIFEITEEPLTGGWRFGYGRRFYDYPDRFALIYDHAYARNLIIEGPDGFLRCPDEPAQWTEWGLIAKQRSVLSHYLSAYRRPIPRLPQIVRLLGYASADDWFNSDSTLEAYGNLVNAYYYDTRQAVWEHRIIKMLRHLGVIRVGEDEMRQTWFQTTKLCQQLLTPENLQVPADEVGEMKRVLIVQPNFEVFVTADQPRVTAELATFSELKQSGALCTYRLSKESVLRGLQTGRAIDKCVEFLQRNAAAPVPGNVERMLVEWGRAFETKSVADQSLSG